MLRWPPGVRGPAVPHRPGRAAELRRAGPDHRRARPLPGGRARPAQGRPGGAMADAAPAAAAGVNSGRVGRWLASHVEGLTLPVEFELVSGGRSNLTYRLTDAG